MRPTVRSRLWAAGTAFALGFLAANVALLAIDGIDRWLWIGSGLLLMATGAWGVVVADSPRPISVWAVLGVELMVLFTVVPFVWAVSLATSPIGEVRTVVPQGFSPDTLTEVFSAELLRATAVTATVAALATLLALTLGVPAAYALVRRDLRGASTIYLGVVVVLLAPVVAMAGGVTDQVRVVGGLDTRLGLAIPMLLVTLPLAIWLCVPVMRSAPWSLDETAVVDGATPVQRLLGFGLPVLGPRLGVVAAVVLIVATHDTVLGSALSLTDHGRPLSALLLARAQEPDGSPGLVAAAGLVWIVAPLILLLVAPRSVTALIDRTGSAGEMTGQGPIGR